MAILEILQYPDPRLTLPAQRVEKIDAATRKLIDDMTETMYAAPGVGLAATQVDVHKQIIVIDVSEDRSDLRVFINPEITRREGAGREPGGLPFGPRHLRQRRARRKRHRDRARPQRLALHAQRLRACSPPASSTRWTTSRARSSSSYLSDLKQNRIRAKLKKRQRKAA